METENYLGKEKIGRLVFKIAIPSMLAQFVSVLYSIVDRIFVGNIPGTGNICLAAIGICSPILTMITAFAFLIGIGGGPQLGIALGEENKKKASDILANSFLMLCGISLIVTIVVLIFKGPMLRLFGASDVTFDYANQYFTIYICGTIFALLQIGMYQFVSAQGYAKVGMASSILGAVLNILLDPLFIYVFKLGIRGAAIATIISQAASAFFVTYFLFTKANIKITFKGYSSKIMLRVIKLGLSPFIIIAMDNVMLIAMNALLAKYGKDLGDFYITVNTIVQSFMLVLTMPLGGISGGTQCILSFNYGAGHSNRVIKAQKYIVGICIAYNLLLFFVGRFFGKYFVLMFTKDSLVIKQACRAINICTLGVIPMAIQYAIVDGFTAMGQVPVALTLSFWRKTAYFVALFIIPLFTGVEMLFYAQPISDFTSNLLSIPLYFLLIHKILRHREEVISRTKNLEE